MKKAYLLLAAVIGIASVSFPVAIQATRQAEPAAAVDDTTQKILETTIQILMFKPNQSDGTSKAENRDEYRMVAAIGTLQVKQGQAWLVTHSHWDEYLVRGSLVQLREAGGKLLAVMEMADFRRLIRYQDEGSLLLKLSPELQAALLPTGPDLETLAMPSAGRPVQPGDIVQVTHQQAGSQGILAVREARVEALSRYAGLQTMQLSTLDGQPIVKGDSGGGIWLDGRLIGTMWASLYNNQTDAPTGQGFGAIVPFGQV